MSDLIDMNAEATKQGLEAMEKRIQQLETDLLTMRNQYQTIVNLVTQLQQTNNLALAKLTGTGATS